MSLGRALHRATRNHRAKMADRHQQALNRMRRMRYGSCERKTRYVSQAQAERSRDSHTAGCVAYRCGFCAGGWHLTSKANA